MRGPRVALLGVALALLAAPLSAGDIVSHPQLGLRLTVPDGFAPDPSRTQGKAVFAFQRPRAGEEKVGVGTFIAVSRLGAVIGREKINTKEVAAKNPQVTIVTEKWKSFEIEVFRIPEQVGEIRMVTFNAQVPLKPEAVQLSVIGEANDEEELRTILRGVLNNLDGDTNWLNESQRSEQLAEGITRLIVAGAVVVGIPVVIWQVVRNSKGRHATGRNVDKRRTRPQRRLPQPDRESDDDGEGDRGDSPRRRRKREDDD